MNNVNNGYEAPSIEIVSLNYDDAIATSDFIENFGESVETDGGNCW